MILTKGTAGQDEGARVNACTSRDQIALCINGVHGGFRPDVADWVALKYVDEKRADRVSNIEPD